MDEIKYIEGEYYPKKGEYYHKCVVCHEGYFGRENKIHCSEKCRFHKNNKKAKNKKVGTRVEFKQIALFDEVLKTYYPASKGKRPISDEILTHFKLNLDLHTGLSVCEKSGLMKFEYLDYSFTRDEINKTIIIYKKDESH